MALELGEAIEAVEVRSAVANVTIDRPLEGGGGPGVLGFLRPAFAVRLAGGQVVRWAPYGEPASWGPPLAAGVAAVVVLGGLWALWRFVGSRRR